MNKVKKLRHFWNQKAGDRNASETWKKTSYKILSALVQWSQIETSSLGGFMSRLDRTQGAQES